MTDPVPGGRPGDSERAGELAFQLSGTGVAGVVLSWVDTAGVNRVKTVPLTALERAATWGVGMSPVFDTFLADDSIVATDVDGARCAAVSARFAGAPAERSPSTSWRGGCR